MSVAQAISEATLLTPSELILVEGELRDLLNRAQGTIKEACVNLLDSGGKRIRPVLAIYSARCFGAITNETIYAALAAELIHMASLVHDDVIDGANLRRGRSTINSVHGNQVAVLTGDYLFAEAFKLLASHKLTPCMGFLLEAIQQMCEGEVNQARDKFATDVSQADYMKRIAQKTGILLAASCKCGAWTAGAKPEEIAGLEQYGLNLGYAFQIVDDILDFVGTEQDLGKPIGLDLASGNITLPAILLLQDAVYGPWLKQVLQAQQITSEGIESVREALISTNSIARSYALAAQCVDKAKAGLAAVPSVAYRNILGELADLVLVRQA